MARKKTNVVEENATDVVENASETTGFTRSGDDIQKEKIRNLVSSVYDIQKLRIATGNRIVQSFNIQMGQLPQTKQADMEEDTTKLIETLRKEYKRITDAYVNKQYGLAGSDSGKTNIHKKKTRDASTDNTVTEVKVVTLAKNASINSVIKTMTTDENADINIIKSKLDYDLIGTYVDLLETEERTLRILSKEVEKHPMWEAFFKYVKGCGPLMAAMCIAYFNIDVARHVSSFWKYAGLDTVNVVKEDGTVVNEGRAARHAKYNDIEYIDKNGEKQTRHGLGYNPELKTKLIGVLGPCMLKSSLRTLKGADGKPLLDADGNKQQVATGYAKVYLDYMARLNNRTDKDSLTPAHKYAMANRYMVKMFIRDLWVTWREYAGYEVSEPYEVAKLGMKPHAYNEYHERVAKETKARRANATA